MEIYAINGSPRKNWNTGAILQKALDGAAENNPEVLTETINLYDYDYSGCTSCFACKQTGAPSYGKCAINDEIAPLLRRILQADAVIFGSPIYFGDISGMLRRFLERLLYPCAVYDPARSSLAPKQLRTGFIYTMNATKEKMLEEHYPQHLATMQNALKRLFGHPPRLLYVNDTYQFCDYSKYKTDKFSEADKALQRKNEFPIDCRKAMELGAAIAADVAGEPESPFE